ncbi:MAG: 4-hydroxy-tetrahydrodipicolinate synthase [Rhodospirillaceae bacterium]|nr:4-hydroxy-tetrahydrodipicolinate synthase [Rhodospirillaceae bacterium]
MAQQVLRGVFTPLITPFANGAVDYAAYTGLVDWQIAQGAHGLVVGGTSGEPMALSIAERMNLLRVALSAARRRVPVIAATGAASVADTLALTRHAGEAGAAAVLALTPPYAKPSQAGLLATFDAIARATDRPILVYQITSRTNVTMSLETLVELTRRHGHIVGMKQSDNDRDLVRAALREIGPGFRAFMGLFDVAWDMVEEGAAGFIVALSNVIPGQIRETFEAAEAGDRVGAGNAYERIAPLVVVGAMDTNPVPVKYMAWRMGLIPSPECRLPLTPMEDRVAARIDVALDAAGLISHG